MVGITLHALFYSFETIPFFSRPDFRFVELKIKVALCLVKTGPQSGEVSDGRDFRSDLHRQISFITEDTHFLFDVLLTSVTKHVSSTSYV